MSRSNVYAFLLVLCFGFWVAPADAILQFESTRPMYDDADTGGRDDLLPHVAADGFGGWLTTWQSGLYEDRRAMVSRSSDGETWTTPVDVAPGVTAVDEPNLASDGAGRWVVAFARYPDVYVVRSSDNGKTWGTPAVAGTDTSSFGVQVATDGEGTWLLVWTRRLTVSSDWDLRFMRSTDGGVNWTLPAYLNSNGGTDSGDDQWPELSMDSAGNAVVVWSSTEDLGSAIGTDADLLVSRSGDGGATWSAPAALNSGAGSDSDGDYTEGLANDDAGTWLVVWATADGSLEGDVRASRSVDAGATWSPESIAMPDRVPDDVPPDLATDGAGNWVSIWGTAGPPLFSWGVSMIHSTDNGNTWSTRKNIAVMDHHGSPTIAGRVATLRDSQGWMVVYEGDILGTGDSPEIFFSTGLDLNPRYAVKLDPTRSYLFQSPFSADSVPIRLPDLGLYGGDEIRLSVVGDYDHDSGDANSDDRRRTVAVFSASDTLLANPTPPGHDPLRVSGAVETGADEVTVVSATGSWTTDIDEDFAIADAGATFTSVTLTVPHGAPYLFVAAHDSDYTDNTDPDGDYAVAIQPVIPIPALPGWWMAVLAGGLVAVAATFLGRRAV